MLLQEIKNIQTTKKILKNFGILLAIFLSILAGISFWKGGNGYMYLLPAVLAVFFSSMFFPEFLKFIYVPWMTAATMIGWAITRVILTILYYLVFTPVGVIAWLLGKDLLDEKFETEKPSYWVRREKKAILSEELEKQF